MFGPWDGDPGHWEPLLLKKRLAGTLHRNVGFFSLERGGVLLCVSDEHLALSEQYIMSILLVHPSTVTALRP